jgi:hypothetical protein
LYRQAPKATKGLESNRRWIVQVALRVLAAAILVHPLCISVSNAALRQRFVFLATDIEGLTVPLRQ